MRPPTHNRFNAGCFGSPCMAMVMLVCLCVLIQLLGMPIILLSPLDAADHLATSFIEGFALPSSLPQPLRSIDSTPVTEVYLSVHAPILASAMFHPPVH